MTDNTFHTSKTTVHDGTSSFSYEDEFFNLYTRKTHFTAADKDYPHTHPYHEIFILLDGHLDYLVEGTIFPLKTGDAVLISAGDPHSKFMIPDVNIYILVIELPRDFFEKNDCVLYEKIFTSHQSCDHKISADSAKESGLSNAYKRLIHYCEGEPDYCRPVIKSTLIEILYLLNNSEFSTNYIANSHIQQAIEYINSNYTNKITLDDIADKLFITKYYLCKMFRKHTGDTIKNYITKKRLSKVEQLTNNGYSISAACFHSGFTDYTSFYKAFLKANGKPPKHVLK